MTIYFNTISLKDAYITGFYVYDLHFSLTIFFGFARASVGFMPRGNLCLEINYEVKVDKSYVKSMKKDIECTQSYVTKVRISLTSVNTNNIKKLDNVIVDFSKLISS